MNGFAAAATGGSGELEARYFERMKSSLGDKERLLRFLPAAVDAEGVPTRVLDVGAGGGEFAIFLKNSGYDVVALDANADAVARMKNIYDLEAVHALANHGTDLLEEGSFDAVVCSSILHEIFSYGDDVRSRGHISSLSRAVEDFRKLLKPGGVFVIRDGVLPESWAVEGEITLLDGHDVNSVYAYLGMCPFSNGQAHAEWGEVVQLRQVGDKTFRGNVRSLLEFSYTYTWGLDSYPRETQELYAVNTLQGYAEFFEGLGFDVEFKESYLQPGYPQHLSDSIRLDVNGDGTWFDSNAVWVCRKPEV